MSLTIGVLGPLIISVDGVIIIDAPKKAKALLVYLACQRGARVSRERLADLLWYDQQSKQSRHSLRNSLTELRHALGSQAERHLVTSFTHCRLADAVGDLDDLDNVGTTIADLKAATELWRGEFLDDFPRIHSEPWNEWMAVERERVAALFQQHLLALLKLASASGEHRTAIKAGRQLTALNPICETNHRALTHAYAAAGRTAEALHHYDVCAEILRRELGVGPDEETRRQHRRIRARVPIDKEAEVPADVDRGKFMRLEAANRELKARNLRLEDLLDALLETLPAKACAVAA